MDEAFLARLLKAIHIDAFRAALKALREQFARAADRFSDVFYEHIAIGSPDPSQWDPRDVCRAFIEANRSMDVQEEWYLLKDGRVCGRLYGDLTGIKEFKRLGDSLSLAIQEAAVHHALVTSNEDYEYAGFCGMLRLMTSTAYYLPMPLLWSRRCRWGTDEPVLDEGPSSDETVPASGDRPPYPLHPRMVRLVHNVFTSTAAFIDTLIDPMKNVFPLSVGERLDPENAPITLPQDSEGEAKEPKDEGTPTGQQDNKYPYLIRRQGRAWTVRFEGEEEPFSGKKKLLAIAKLLRRHGEQIDALELDREGIDVEREEKAKQARSELSDKVQLDGLDDKIDEEGIQFMMKRIEGLEGDIRFAMGQPDLEEMDEVEKLTVKLRQICRYLDKATCDKEYMERKSRAGEQGGAANQERACDITDRIDELLEQIEHARNSGEGKKVVVLRKELRELLHRLLDTPREKMKHRRSRRNSGPEEDSRKAVLGNIKRAKEDIAKVMPRCGEYLEEKVIQVGSQAKWVYIGDIVWKVEGI